MKRSLKLTAVIMMIFFTLTALSAQDARTLIARADKAFELDGIYSRSTLEIIKNGKEQAPQVMDSYELDDSRGISRSLTVFIEPARVAGTAYLMVGDDLWVRFASTGRTRKLSSSAKKNSAAGSDFSYSDMGDGSSSFTSRYEPAYDGSEKIEGQDCHRLVLTPLPGEDSTYEKLIVWISKENDQYRRIEYHEDGSPVKVLDMEDYRETGGVLYPYKMTMTSLTKKSVSIITTDLLEQNSSKVRDGYFTASYLDSIR